MKKFNEKIILIIRDGWGFRKEKKDNAIAQANTPFNDLLIKNCPNTLLDVSGEAVGLPKGYQGNSEVGHLTIGSGRIIYQSLERINKAIKTKEFFKNKAFLYVIKNCKKNNSVLHLIGLLQKEGVHAHLDHLFALLDLCKKEKLYDVNIHIITDGRDSPVTNSLVNLKLLENKIKKIGFGEIVSVSGRFYAMDRDNRWERTCQAYRAIADGKSKITFEKAKSTILESHKHKKTDEFIWPRIKIGYNGIKENDSIIFYNFRTDRTRQLTKALVEKDFNKFRRDKIYTNFVGMTNYYAGMNRKIAFPDISLKNLLGEVVASEGLKQLRISETEKYAHVTFFFNGQCEKPNKKEDRILIPSPKVETYDLAPEMKAKEIAEKIIKTIKQKDYDLIVTNLVNCDMIGHTGDKKAILKGVEAVDNATGEIVEAGLLKDYTILIFADHGNAEDQTKKWGTSHTINKVPFILVSNNKNLQKENCKLKKGKGLQDIAPTVLALLNIKKPKEMTGKSIC